MNKGFSIIEMIICVMLMSICTLSTITVYSNIKQQIVLNNEKTMYYEKMKLVSKYLTIKLNKNPTAVYIKNNELWINNEKFIDYENEEITIYQDGISIYNEKISNVDLIYCNEHLLLVRLQNQKMSLEKYYYLGGSLIEN